MESRGRTLTGMALALALAMMPAQVTAQAAPDVPDDQELEAFTEAYFEISQVRDQMSPELAAAETAEEANQLQQQANDRMMGILENHGMSVERYSEITTLLNADEELRAEFEALYSELTGRM
ncbi:MAG: DUF4168 domain-containing protein [Gemmatimonadota bacterium]